MMQHEDNEGRIDTEERGSLLLISIDRPKKLNGFTPTMMAELARAYSILETENYRCGILYAVGDNFTAGLDLPTMAPLFRAGESIIPAECVDPFNLRPPFRQTPLVVAVQGYCYTLGIEVMLAADIVVAASDTRFSQLEVKRGVMATGGATIRMVERSGWGNAMRYLLTGDEFDAETAFRLNFVQEVVESGEQLDRAIEIGQQIAASAPLAVSQTIVSARFAIDQGPVAASSRFTDVQTELMRSADAAEGVRSFVERRTPQFTGR